MSEIRQQIEDIVRAEKWSGLHSVGECVELRYRQRGRVRARYICEIPAGKCPKQLGWAIIKALTLESGNIAQWSTTKHDRVLVLRGDRGLLSPWRASSTKLSKGCDTLDEIHRRFKRHESRWSGVSGARALGNPADTVCPY